MQNQSPVQILTPDTRNLTPDCSENQQRFNQSAI
jgi:hypothetical protein